MNIEVDTQTAPDAEQAIASSIWQGLFSTEVDQFARSWLSLVLDQIGDCRAAAVFAAPSSGGQWQLVAGSLPPADRESYSELLSAVLQNPVADVHQIGDNPAHVALCYPVLCAGDIEAVALVDAGPANEKRLGEIMRSLQWGVGQLESFFQRRALEAQGNRSSRIMSSLELALSTLEQPTMLEAARALTTEIAVKLGAQRVSIGITEGQHCSVLSMSHTAQFAEEANFTRLVAAAMDEAIDQHNLVLLPNNLDRDAAPVTWANRELQQVASGALICTVHFEHGDEFSGALVLEFADPDGLDAGGLAVVEAITAMLAPILDLYRRNEQGVRARTRSFLKHHLGKFFGPGHIMLKTVSLFLVLFLVFASLYPAQFRVTADAILEGQKLRAAVTPFDGYIDEAFHRAGDVVEEGALLATLDSSDIVLELNKWRAKRQQMLRRLREAKADQNNANLRVVQSQLGEAAAEIDLLESRLERTQVSAPFSGYIVSGDLSESLGAPVQRGDVLFELAPLDNYRVIARVDERDIRHLQVEQGGQLILKGISEQTLPVTVTRITPVAEVIEGVNAFEVEAMMDDTGDAIGLLPGMEGVVKVEVGEASLLWIWTRRFFEWARLWLWSWWP